MATPWSTIQSSWNTQGPFRDNLPYHPNGIKAAYKQAYGPYKWGSEGLLHSMKRSIMDAAGHDYGMRVMNAEGTGTVKYGGSLFSRAGFREVTHTVEKTVNYGPVYNHSPNLEYSIGKKRTAAGMLKKGAMKYGLNILGAASFINTWKNEGLGTAVGEAVVINAGIGAAKWGLAKVGAGLVSGGAMAAMAVAGVGYGSAMALRAGRDYNKTLRIASMGSAYQDTFGNAATIRQASVNAIQSSKINGRNALGNEASLMHM